MSDPLGEALRRLGTTLKQALPQPTFSGRPLVPPRPPKELLLYVYRVRCRNCGDEVEWYNNHLLGVYTPFLEDDKYHAARYIGPIPEGTPCILVRNKEPLYHDWCPKCFPATQGKDE